jgi:hypothetical protein
VARLLNLRDSGRRLKVDGERVEGDEGGFSLRKRAEKSM